MTQDRAELIRVFAPAKINLTLHVTGQRPDGFHLLDSLVVFADVGDVIEFSRGMPMFSLCGPQAAALENASDNLVMQMAHLFPELADLTIRLTKNLPVSSGIGGGSADAAAAFRGLMALCGDGAADVTGKPQVDQLLRLGADIPMCIASAAARIREVGEDITHVPDMPPLHAVLVNPGVAVSTPAVFNALAHRNNAPMPEKIPTFTTGPALARWLSGQRNDLQAAAMSLEPEIGVVITVLNGQMGCLLARMSGSGATCFGLFGDAADARAAAQAIQDRYPNWWVRVTELGTQTERASPQIR